MCKSGVFWIIYKLSSYGTFIRFLTSSGSGERLRRFVLREGGGGAADLVEGPEEYSILL